jgi:hypothetical protein
MPGSGKPTGAGSPGAEDLDPDEALVAEPTTADHGEQTMTK